MRYVEMLYSEGMKVSRTFLRPADFFPRSLPPLTKQTVLSGLTRGPIPPNGSRNYGINVQNSGPATS